MQVKNVKKLKLKYYIFKEKSCTLYGYKFTKLRGE